MEKRNSYINSVNLNLHTDFPYLVLNVENDRSYPLNPGFRVMHWHEDLQFIYVIEGTICVKTLETEEIVSAGEGIYINKNVVHLVEKISACKYKSFLFPEYFVSHYPIAPTAQLTAAITENKGISLVMLYESMDWCKEALRVLREMVELEKEKSDSIYPYTVLSKLSELWLAMLQNLSLPESTADNATAIRMRAFLKFIEEHYAEEISLDALAASANVSKSEALRCFKTTLQTTPYKYLMDYRLQRASNLLKETDLPISRIASMTGFNQQSYFGKCFKEKMNCTPIEFRNKKNN